MSMPHKVRFELEAIIDEVTYMVNQEAEQLNQADRERIRQAGTSQIIALSDEERQAWREKMRPVWQQFEPVIGADIIKAAEHVNRRSR